MTKLKELKVAYEAATPGEWWEDDDGFVAAGHGDSYRTVADARCDVAPFSDANTEFIALAHNLMPQLLEAVEVLKAVVPLMDIAFNYDGDVFGRQHNNATDVYSAAECVLGELE